MRSGALRCSFSCSALQCEWAQGARLCEGVYWKAPWGVAAKGQARHACVLLAQQGWHGMGRHAMACHGMACNHRCMPADSCPHASIKRRAATPSLGGYDASAAPAATPPGAPEALELGGGVPQLLPRLLRLLAQLLLARSQAARHDAHLQGVWDGGCGR